jgi:hypothetical protein
MAAGNRLIGALGSGDTNLAAVARLAADYSALAEQERLFRRDARYWTTRANAESATLDELRHHDEP